MLTQDEESQVRDLFTRVAQSGQVQAAEMATILARLPRKPEALELMRDLARSRGLPWVEYLSKTIHAIKDVKGDDSLVRPPTGCLADVLRSDQPYPRKVEALMAAQKGGDPELLQVVREFMPGEPDPFVLATMAAVLGQKGDAQDRDRLLGALGNADHRVVANVLEAIYRLKLQVPLSKVQHLLDSADNRVKMNALAVFTLINPVRALDMLKALAAQQNPQVRGAAAFLLGELSETQAAIELLVSLLETEENTAVLKQVAYSLKKLGSRTNLTDLLGPLYAKRVQASGAKRSILEMMLFTIASSSNLTSQQVQEIGETFVRSGEGRAHPGRSSLARVTAVTKIPEGLPQVATKVVTEVTAPAPAPEVAPEPRVAAPSTDAPASEEVVEEEDEPLSFTGVWGAATGGAPALTTTGYFNTADVLGKVDLPSGSTSRTPSRKIPQAELPPPAIARTDAGRFKVPALWALVGLSAIVVVGGVFSYGGAGPAAQEAARPAGKGKKEKPPTRLASGGGPAGASKLDRPAPELKGSMGPAGAPIDVKGTVIGVTSGRPLLESKGNHYLVLKGRLPDAVRQGDQLEVHGKIMGTSRQGIVYVEGSS